MSTSTAIQKTSRPTRAAEPNSCAAAAASDDGSPARTGSAGDAGKRPAGPILQPSLLERLGVYGMEPIEPVVLASLVTAEPLLLVQTEPAAGATLVNGPIAVEVRGVVQPGTTMSGGPVPAVEKAILTPSGRS